MRPIRIERRELHGQMVDVKVYGPGPSQAGDGRTRANPGSARLSDRPDFRSMSRKAFEHCLLAGNTRGLTP